MMSRKRCFFLASGARRGPEADFNEVCADPLLQEEFDPLTAAGLGLALVPHDDGHPAKPLAEHGLLAA